MSTLIALAALLSLQDTTVPDLSWMSGAWLDCSRNAEVAEVWSEPRQGLMVGYNMTVRRGRAGFEFSRIEVQSDGRLAYVAQPGGQPATVFPLLRHDDASVTFSNPGNDFPQRIIYQRQGDLLVARIEGSDEDPNRSVEWSFNKAELNSHCP